MGTMTACSLVTLRSCSGSCFPDLKKNTFGCVLRFCWIYVQFSDERSLKSAAVAAYQPGSWRY